MPKFERRADSTHFNPLSRSIRYSVIKYHQMSFETIAYRVALCTTF